MIAYYYDKNNMVEIINVLSFKSTFQIVDKQVFLKNLIYAFQILNLFFLIIIFYSYLSVFLSTENFNFKLFGSSTLGNCSTSEFNLG